MEAQQQQEGVHVDDPHHSHQEAGQDIHHHSLEGQPGASNVVNPEIAEFRVTSNTASTQGYGVDNEQAGINQSKVDDTKGGAVVGQSVEGSISGGDSLVQSDIALESATAAAVNGAASGAAIDAEAKGEGEEHRHGHKRRHSEHETPGEEQDEISSKRERLEGEADVGDAAAHEKPPTSVATPAQPAAPAPAPAQHTAPHVPHVVRLRGLPFGTTQAEVQQFLHGLQFENVANPIHLPLDVKGRTAGSAFARLATDADVKRALSSEYHRKMMGTRYVEVFSADLAEMLQVEQNSARLMNQLQKENYVPPSDSIIIKLRGLSFETHENDIIKFFSPTHIRRVHVLLDDRNRAAGDAFLEMSNEADADAILAHNKAPFGRRYLEIFKSDVTAMMQRLQTNRTHLGPATYNQKGGAQPSSHGSNSSSHHHQQPHQQQHNSAQNSRGSYGHGHGHDNRHDNRHAYQQPYQSQSSYQPREQRDYPSRHAPNPQQHRSGGGGGGRVPATSTSCMRVLGLPFHSNENDLTDFFADVRVYPQKLHRRVGTGEAFVEFNSSEDLQTAMKKHRQYMKGSNRYLELYPVSYSELASTVGLPAGPYANQASSASQYGGHYSNPPPAVQQPPQHQQQYSQPPPQHHAPPPASSSYSNYNSNSNYNSSYGSSSYNPPPTSSYSNPAPSSYGAPSSSYPPPQTSQAYPPPASSSSAAYPPPSSYSAAPPSSYSAAPPTSYAPPANSYGAPANVGYDPNAAYGSSTYGGASAAYPPPASSTANHQPSGYSPPHSYNQAPATGYGAPAPTSYAPPPASSAPYSNYPPTSSAAPYPPSSYPPQQPPSNSYPPSQQYGY